MAESWWEKKRRESEDKVNASINKMKGGGSAEDVLDSFGDGVGNVVNPTGMGTGEIGMDGEGGIFPGGGGALGPWDVLGKKFDDMNPYVKEKVTYDPVKVDKIYGDYKGATDAFGNFINSNYKQGAPKTLYSQMGDALGLKELQTRATQKGPSAWAQMAEQGQRLDEQNMLNQAAQAQAGQQAGARSNLAMRGGLRGGAAERLAASGSENALLGGQGIRNQGMQGRLGIGMQDESNKLNLLSQLPGAELAQAGYKSGLDQQNISNKLGVDQYNINNSLADMAAKNQWKKDLATGTIAATGAAQSAAATENAGKK
jgi:hypothetical protein